LKKASSYFTSAASYIYFTAPNKKCTNKGICISKLEAMARYLRYAITPRYPLSVTLYPSPITRHPLLVALYPLPVTSYPLPVTQLPVTAADIQHPGLEAFTTPRASDLFLMKNHFLQLLYIFYEFCAARFFSRASFFI
jgi:hypothetical protein